MTRIHNKNFQIERDKSYGYTVWGFLKPAAVVTLTAVIVFFAIDLNTIDMQNPLLDEPEPMDVSIGDSEENLSLQKEFIVEESDKLGIESKDEVPGAIAGTQPAENKTYKVVINENDVISKEILELPLDEKSVDVDSHLRKNKPYESKSRLLTVGSGESNKRINPVFDGFHTRSIENKWLRDSVTKIADSLRKSDENLRKK
jgi:hypothetical protein